MKEIRERAKRYAREHHLQSGISLMRAYIAGALSERKERIFLSGKVSGEDYHKAYRKFSDAEKSLESSYKVSNPMVLCRQEWSWLRCMAVCLWHLSKCRHIYMLPDWRESRGARIEHRFAQLLNIEIHETHRNRTDIE